MTIEDIKKVFTEKVKGDTLISPHILDCMLFYEGFTLEVIDTIKHKFNKGIADVENIEQERVNKANKENKRGFIMRQYLTSQGMIIISYSMSTYSLFIMTIEAYKNCNFDLKNLSEV